MTELYRLVACCVDDSDAAREALLQAARLARVTGARLAAVHVVESPGGFSGGRTPYTPDPEELAAELREDGRRRLEGLIASVPDAAGAEPVVLQGDPPEEAVAWAERAGCDLLVTAAHRQGLTRALLGSFSGALVRDAPCPVLVDRRR